MVSQFAMYCAAAALLLLGGCADPGACRLSLLTQAPLRAEHGYLYTEFGVNGHAANMIVDTGAFVSLLSQDAVERYGVATAQSTQSRVEGIGGSRRLDIVAPGQVSFGRLTGERFTLASTGWNGPPTQPPTDGLLGVDLLGVHDVDYDVLGGHVTFYKPQGRCDQAPVALSGDLYEVDMLPDFDAEARGFDTATAESHTFRATPGFGVGQRVFVSVTIDGHDFRALLDTGADYSLLYRGAAARLGLEYATLAAQGQTGRIGGIGPNSVGVVRHVLPSVKFGEIEIRNFGVGILDQDGRGVDMLLGQNFLRKVHVWMSNSHHKLILQVPPRPSPPVDLAASR